MPLGGFGAGAYVRQAAQPSLLSRGLDLATGGIGGLAFKLGKGLFGKLFNRGAEKRAAKNAQKAAQWRVNQKQKGLNRKSTNFASLLKSLKREGWYGPEYMQKFGTPDLRNWQYDQVPLEAGQSLMGAIGEGLTTGAGDYFSDAEATRRDADAEVARLEAERARRS